MTAYLSIISVALPIVLARLVQTLGFVIGSLMVAHLGHEVLAASALSTTIAVTLFTFCSGALYSIAQLIAKEHVRYNYQQIATILVQGAYFVVFLSIFVLLILYHIDYVLTLFYQPYVLVHLVSEYYYYFALGVIPMLLTTALQECLIGCHRQKIIFAYSLIRLSLGTLLNYMFIFGKFGAPNMGYAGLGLSISIASTIGVIGLFLYLCICYWQYIKKLHVVQAIKLQFDVFWSVVRLGFPIGIQVSGEILAITVSTLLIGRFGVYALSSQQITSQYLLLVTMVPFGISHAMTVLISKAIEQKQIIVARDLRNKSLILISAIMFILAVMYYLLPAELARVFIHSYTQTTYNEIMQLTVKFFYILAFYQFFDGIRNVTAGILYGYGNTIVSMLSGLGAFWLIAIPLAYLLAFVFQLGVIWIPLSLMLAVFISGLVSLIYCLRLKVWYETN